MDLLSAAQRAQIRNVMQDVLDTFAKTPITIYLVGTGGTADTWSEDKPLETDTPYNCMAFVEYNDNQGDEAKWTRDGKYNGAEVKCMMGLDDLTTLGLINNENMPIITDEKDRMLVNGEMFYVCFVDVEGAFEQKNILVNVYGKRKPKKVGDE